MTITYEKQDVVLALMRCKALSWKQQIKILEEIKFMSRDRLKWWRSKNLREVAYYQSKSHFLLVNPNDFNKGVTILLGRNIPKIRFESMSDNMKQKIKQAYYEYLAKEFVKKAIGDKKKDQKDSTLSFYELSLIDGKEAYEQFTNVFNYLEKQNFNVQKVPGLAIQIKL